MLDIINIAEHQWKIQPQDYGNVDHDALQIDQNMSGLL